MSFPGVAVRFALPVAQLHCCSLVLYPLFWTSIFPSGNIVYVAVTFMRFRSNLLSNRAISCHLPRYFVMSNCATVVRFVVAAVALLTFAAVIASAVDVMSVAIAASFISGPICLRLSYSLLSIQSVSGVIRWQ